jgi:hypothetical protein
MGRTKIMSKYYYEIDAQNHLRVWDNDLELPGNAPFLFQPDWPDGTPWASRQEVQNWADAYTTALSDPESEFIQGNSPSEPIIPRPAPSDYDPTAVIPVQEGAPDMSQPAPDGTYTLLDES